MAAARAGVTEELAPGRNWTVSIGRKQLPEDLLESTWRCRTAADRCCQLTQRPLQLSAGASLLTPFQSPGLAAGLRGGRVKSLAESSSRRPESDYGVFTTATKITRGPENPEDPRTLSAQARNPWLPPSPTIRPTAPRHHHDHGRLSSSPPCKRRAAVLRNTLLDTPGLGTRFSPPHAPRGSEHVAIPTHSSSIINLLLLSLISCLTAIALQHLSCRQDTHSSSICIESLRTP